jgi:hypothetical protein
VEFQGVGPKVASTFADEFALRSGGVFSRARDAGAGRPAASNARRGPSCRVYFQDNRDTHSRRGEFDLIDRTASVSCWSVFVNRRASSLPDFGDEGLVHASWVRAVTPVLARRCSTTTAQSHVCVQPLR